jgi:FkbM family methyltransferase
MFISYAQNLEDVLLHRVFANKADGFYVDVGAWDPEKDSVTKAFYDAGWKGVNVEPGYNNWRRLARARGRDVNLQVAVSDKEGQGRFLEVAGSGLSSLESGVASSLDMYGLKGNETSVKLTTLARIFEEQCLDREVDFLKIDVEGHEAAVIAGMNWRRFRPKVVLVEATLAESGSPNWAAWEPTLIDANYLFAWFDGLNRFYVRKEDENLLTYFGKPPCVFDGFRLHRNHSLVLARSTGARLVMENYFPTGIVSAMRKLYRRIRRVFSR